MKFSRSSQLLLAAAASLVAATLITACQQFTQTLTVDFVFVATTRAAGASQYGEINVFEINSESGRMRQIPTSPFPSGGRNPVAEAVSNDNQNLFVVNHDDNTIVQFAIGTDGKLYPNDTVNTPGIFPLAIAVGKSNVFVLDSYQPLPLCSPAQPCSGSISVFPLVPPSSVPGCATSVCLAAPANNAAVNGQYWPLSLPGAPSHIVVPTAVSVLPSGNFVYVAAYDATSASPVGYVFAFAVASNGALTAVPGSPFVAGAQPSAIAGDATGSYVYVTDFAGADVWGFSVAPGTAPVPGALAGLSGSPYRAGNQPASIAVDPSYPFAYVANSQDGNIAAYSMSNGVLTSIGDYPTGIQPLAIGIDPSTNHFLYTVNFLSNTISNFQLDTASGALVVTQLSPYATNAQPMAVAAVPHNGSGGGIQ